MALKIKILTVGTPNNWAKPAVEHWHRRIEVFAKIELDFLRTRDKSKLNDAIIKRMGNYPIALTRLGEKLSSNDWAKLLDKTRFENLSPTFIIGGANGLPENIILKCRQKISLSQITLQHDLALIVLLEQIFRGLSINAGTPYHRHHL
ncbi:23S rRNA (pseudouridine(1915)-N(3))-methyltransferase RlmH [bacterium]|nr:23S rRNA (pseudouridine(1915)-N(3))-methyltransferase RlmH [bacterium]